MNISMVVGNRGMLDKDTMNIGRDVRNQEKVSSIKDSRTLGFRNQDPMHNIRAIFSMIRDTECRTL